MGEEEGGRDGGWQRGGGEIRQGDGDGRRGVGGAKREMGERNGGVEKGSWTGVTGIWNRIEQRVQELTFTILFTSPFSFFFFLFLLVVVEGKFLGRRL